MRTYSAVSMYTCLPREGDGWRRRLLSLSLSLGCFAFLGYTPSLIAIRPAAGGRKGKGKERKGNWELRSWNPIDVFRPVEGGRAFREQGERKLVSSVDRSFCFAGHFGNEERKKERKKEFISFLRFWCESSAFAIADMTSASMHHAWLFAAPVLMRSSCCRRPICRLLFMACNWLLALLLVYSVVRSDLPSSIIALLQF
jgi:hypothetical protein